MRISDWSSDVCSSDLSDQSPEAEAAAQALVNTIWSVWKGDVARARPRAKIESYIDALPQQVAAAGGDLAKAGVASGLVDKLGSRAQFARMVARLGRRGSDKTAASWAHVKLADTSGVAPHAAVHSGAGGGGACGQ